MNSRRLSRLQKWFSHYVSGFYAKQINNDRPLRMKEAHTIRVCRDIRHIAQCLGLPAGDRNLAEAMALLHDIGRFSQYERFGTFSDLKSANHAYLGLREIARARLLKNCAKSERLIILKAVAFHNRLFLPVISDSRTLLFSRLLRDADKLDIWNVFADYFRQGISQADPTIHLGLPVNPGFSPSILTALNEKRMARMEDMRNVNDFKLLQIAWVYDLNYAPSFQMLHDRQHIEHISATLPDDPGVSRAVRSALEYVKTACSRTGSVAL